MLQFAHQNQSYYFHHPHKEDHPRQIIPLLLCFRLHFFAIFGNIFLRQFENYS
ncbi:hypothetical protein LDG_7317 [Legionella drancourtii LLAP12]|uniref:Uncharacterized protein n=1 Tax=Legionella drancourtii LLAP12 TaxID=658187 RepID=G9EPX6_9GAMM|nr:hypothetical protein LDG_7317 [Legionella drancourtii LLAP12]